MTKEYELAQEITYLENDKTFLEELGKENWTGEDSLHYIEICRTLNDLRREQKELKGVDVDD